MPEPDAPRVARKALKFTGNVAKGEFAPGFIAHDLTQEQAEVWLTDAQYQDMLASGYYEEATKTEAKAIEADAAPDRETPPKRPARHKE